MNCPKCGSKQTRVLETAHGSESKIYRRRNCLDCDTMFKTMEHVLPDDEQSQNDYREAIINRSALLRKIYK